MSHPVQPATKTGPPDTRITEPPRSGEVVRPPSSGASSLPDAQPPGVPSIDPSWTPAECARRGEDCRFSGNYSDAVSYFNRAIELTDVVTAGPPPTKQPRYLWAYARRGAAHAALGNFEDGLKDLEVAEAPHARGTQGDGALVWIRAQKGELYRLWARAVVSNRPRRTPVLLSDAVETAPEPWPAVAQALALLGHAIDEFDKALTNGGGNAWTYAHRGAAYTMRYWVSQLGDEMRAKLPPSYGDDYANGIKSFRAACEASPSYGWAYAFSSVLHCMGDEMDKGLEMLGKAQLSGLDRPLSLIRIVMELSMYNGRNAESAQAALQALQIDSEETFARYFLADALSQLHHSEAHAAVNRARMELDSMQARLYAMAGGLDCLEGHFSDAERQLELLADKRDMEALSLVKHDPAWKAVRDGAASSDADLRAAHTAYKKLFAF